MWKPKSVVVASPLAPQIVDDLKGRWEGVVFHACPTVDSLRMQIAEADALVAFRIPADLDVGHVRWIHSLGAGVDGLLSHPKLPADLLMTRTIGRMPRAMAEYCLAHLLADCQNIGIYRQQQVERAWVQQSPTQLSGKEVLVLGTGGMGCGIAELLTQVGCRVWGASRSGEDKAPFYGVKGMDDLHDLAPRISAVICTLPLTPGTRGLVDGEFFSRFRQIHFMNVGRGGVVEHDALRESLNGGQVRIATLDVFPEEPLESSHWLWEDPRVQITPHISALTTADSVLAEFIPIMNSLNKGLRDFPTVDFARGY